MSVKTAPWTSDIWAEYARLKSLGWTQQRNAKAKNVDRSWVARRLQFYTLSDKVKNFISKGLLTELHLQEICRLSVTDIFHPWQYKTTPGIKPLPGNT